MPAPSIKDIEIIDKIIAHLWLTPPEYVASFDTVLKPNFPELLSEDNKDDAVKLFSTHNLCVVKSYGNKDITFSLTTLAKEIMGKYGSYSKYLEHEKALQNKQNKIYENSVSSIALSTRSIEIAKRNTTWVIVGVFVTILSIIITIIIAVCA